MYLQIIPIPAAGSSRIPVCGPQTAIPQQLACTAAIPPLDIPATPSELDRLGGAPRVHTRGSIPRPLQGRPSSYDPNRDQITSFRAYQAPVHRLRRRRRLQPRVSTRGPDGTTSSICPFQGIAIVSCLQNLAVVRISPNCYVF